MANAESHADDILDDLLNDLVDMAVERLETQDTFQPFGAVITTAGELEPTPFDGKSAEEVIAAIVADHKARAAAKQIDAAGICFDFRLDAFEGRPETDAICCRLETRLGEALTAYLPYQLHADRAGDDRMELGELMATIKKPEIFPTASAPPKRR